MVAMGPVSRNKTLAGRVTMAMWGWLMAMRPLTRTKILAGEGQDV